VTPRDALGLVDELVRRAHGGCPVSHEALTIALILAGFAEPDARGLATRLLAEVARVNERP
jgi:hypothetical protein